MKNLARRFQIGSLALLASSCMNAFDSDDNALADPPTPCGRLFVASSIGAPTSANAQFFGIVKPTTPPPQYDLEGADASISEPANGNYDACGNFHAAAPTNQCWQTSQYGDPYGSSGQWLDAGDVVFLESGEQAVELPRVSPGNYQAGGDAKFLGGASYTVTSRGHAWTDALILPTDVAITTPSSGAEIDLTTGQGMKIGWVSSASGEFVDIQVTTPTSVWTCNVSDTGSFEIPASVTALFPSGNAAVTVRTVIQNRLPLGTGVFLLHAATYDTVTATLLTSTVQVPQ